MKKLLFLFAFLNTSLIFAQELTNWCGTDAIREQMRTKYSNYDQQIAEFEENLQNLKHHQKALRGEPIIIPVVFHIVHNDTAVLNDITPAQIQSQIDALNRDFRQQNADFMYLPAVFQERCNENTDIQFCLAKQDPNGLKTYGIEYKKTTADGFLIGEDTNPDRSVKWTTKGLGAWDNNRYLNIWVCKILPELDQDIAATGFALLPPIPTASQWRDGVVIDYRSFGSVGRRNTEIKYFSGNMGRTCVHEVGHYLGLLHLWGGQPIICTDADLCSDTPIQDIQNYENPSFPIYNNTCSNITGEGNMFMNYMDYTNDKTRIAFTNDQKMRMMITILDQRQGLLTTSGCETGTDNQKFRNCALPKNAIYIDDIGTTQATVHFVSHLPAYKVFYKTASQTVWQESPIIVANYWQMLGLSPDSQYQVKVLHYSNCNPDLISTAAFMTNKLKNAPAPLPPDAPNTANAATVLDVSSGSVVVEGQVIGTPPTGSYDEDWYRFTTSAGKTNIKVALDYLPFDYDVKVYRSSTAMDTFIVNYPYYSFNPYTMPELVKYNTSNAETYYVQVKSYRPNEFSNAYSYRLSINTSNAHYGKTEDLEVPSSVSNIFVLYPNPASQTVNVLFYSDVTGNADLQIMDMTGRVVIQQFIDVKQGNSPTVDIHSLDRGFYVVSCVVNQQIYTTKLIIY